jgi:PAS domain S-box-containing protein
MDGLLDGIWFWDIEKPENEWMSPRLWTLLGYDPAQRAHLASEWKSLIDPEDLDVVMQNFAKHCADPAHPYDQIVRYRHSDGSTVWVRCRGIAIRGDTGKPIRMLGAHTDLTSQKLAEQNLQRSEKLLSAGLDAIEDGISVLDHELNIIRVNRTMKAWHPHGLPLEGKKCYQAYHSRHEACEVCRRFVLFKAEKSKWIKARCGEILKRGRLSCMHFR